MRTLIPLLALLMLGVGAADADDAGPARRVGVVRVRGDGACRIAPDQWRALGIADPHRLEIRRAGKALPVLVGSEAGLAEGTVAFAATKTATPHSAYAVYELWHLRDARPVLDRPLSPGVPLPREIATDHFWGPLAAADAAIYDTPTPHWFLALAPRGQSVTIQLSRLGAAQGSEQVLEVEVYGAWTDLAILEATWGGTALGRSATPDPSKHHTLRWTVPASAIPATSAPLVLSNRSPPPSPPPPNDVSDGRGTLAIDAVRLVGKGIRLMPWSKARAVTVLPPRATSDPLARAGRARHVILATPALLTGAKRLAAHRRAHGLDSVAIDVADVYDTYGFGEQHPKAIHEFIRALHGRTGAPLDYLVLAGDATFDRTDIRRAITIPTPMARTMYNGATSADVLYANGTPTRPGPAVGRLPFDKAATMDAYVSRVIRYEDKAPLDASRRLLRFITSPGRFGAFLDGVIEARFRRVLSRSIPPAYDVAITYAHPKSAYLWPPAEFNQHVIASINDGSLYTIYVGHGFAQGFDTLRVGAHRFPILHVRDAPQVHVRGTSPVMFVLACTTAMFDGTGGPGIGEALLRQAEGPVAYWGATRVCHPGFNALMGESVAGTLARDAGTRPRLGDLLAAAQAETLDGTNRTLLRAAIKIFARGPSSLDLAREGGLMYTLLGDPALEVAVPRASLEVSGGLDAATREVRVTVKGTFPKGTRVTLALEWPRSHKATPRHKGVDAAAPASYPRIRENHAAANNLALARVEAVATATGVASAHLPLPADVSPSGLVVKAHAIFANDVHSGALVLP